jgi:hypothetical protein
MRTPRDGSCDERQRVQLELYSLFVSIGEERNQPWEGAVAVPYLSVLFLVHRRRRGRRLLVVGGGSSDASSILVDKHVLLV